MNIESIAAVCYEANREYCRTQGLEDHPSWDGAPDWQRNSAIEGVRLHAAYPETTPEQAHESWLSQKEVDGWKYGPVKDAEKKEHPCMVPYSNLPENQKIKDALFGAVVSALAPHLEPAAV